jgi:hypothetical protein
MLPDVLCCLTSSSGISEYIAVAIFRVNMVTVMYAKMSKQLQHMMWLNLESQSYILDRGEE